MSMGIEVAVYLAYAFAVLMVYVFGRFFLVPLKWVLCWLANSVVGGVVIILINYFGGMWGIFVPLNIATAVTAGILGVPGIIALVIFFT